ncbi:SANT associated [Arabidopsis suecica]|uniref:SANT associated n=1 Tax=Arabidopsis suecica TaxID=45249 RepID=A0A8T1Z4H5_ARASU|nr:SANT associated [Arabidopsis suecica]
MAEPNPDDVGSKSYFQKTVVLRDWWLIKCPKEFEGKRFGVAGFEDSVETRAMRVFKSSPIIRALDVFTLLASDGIYITLRGFLNKERVVNSGFTPEISREFIFGFPPCWERFCNSCFVGDSFGTDINTVPSTIDKACPPILSPCKYSNGNVEDNPAESRDKSSVTETEIAEINDKDGSGARAKKTERRKSLHLSEEEERKLESSKVQNTTNEGDHGSECLSKAKSGDVEKDGCEAINNEDNEWKLDGSELQNCTNDGVHGSEGLIKAKSSDVENVECEVIDNNVISPAVGCGIKYTGADNVDKVTSASATVESLTSEQRKDVLGTTASPHSLLKDLDKSSKSEKKGISKKSKNATKESLPSEQGKGRVKVTKASRDPLSKDLINCSKPGKKGKSKKSEKTLQSDSNVVEPMNHSRSEVEEAEENLSWEKIKRKIDFDVEVTPEKEVKKQKTNAASTDSVGQKRSRSGRVLVSSLEFWRNQIPVYDMERNLIQVKDGSETNSTPSKGSFFKLLLMQRGFTV